MFTSPEKNVWEFGFTPGEKVTDFGTGSGHYAMALSKALGEHGRVYSVDISTPALEALKAAAHKEGKHNIEVIYGDIEKLGGTSLRDELADGVVFSNILFQLENPSMAAEEAKRILKPGGRVAVVDWTEKFSKDKAKELFQTAGFSLAREFDAGDEHYGLIFKK